MYPHELLEREDTVKKTTYNPCETIVTVFSSVDELLKLSNITGTSYTQYQEINTAYVILHRTGKFGLAICEWNCMPAVQKTWVHFKQFFFTSHRELRETSDLTVKDAITHHASMVYNIVTGI